MKTRPNAPGTSCAGTMRMIVAVESAQNPPMVTPSKARPARSTAKFGAAATTASEAIMNAVSATMSDRRSKRAAIGAIARLVRTAKSPDIEMA
jgi:hypothetical protein